MARDVAIRRAIVRAAFDQSSSLKDARAINSRA